MSILGNIEDLGLGFLLGGSYFAKSWRSLWRSVASAMSRPDMVRSAHREIMQCY